VNVGTTSVSKMGGMDLLYDFRAETGYVVVEGSESDLPGTAGYAPDLEIELDVPVEQGVEVSSAAEEFFGLQWDKQEQEVDLIHEDKEATGDGARIGIIDDGVLGANPDRDASHPDLANVNRELSRNFTRDGNGPGPLNDDHGTHCAGVAAATTDEEDGAGVLGVAPDAEVVDLRVFSGRSGSFTDVLAAIVYGTKVGCDVLNLSLGTPPLLPVEKPPDEIDPGDDPDGAGPIVPVAAEQLRPLVQAVDVFGQYAVDNGTLPVAAAGNDAVNLDESPPGTDETPVVLPAGAEGFMSVGATGPIGFGWPADDDSEEIAGFEVESPIVTVLRTEEPAFYTNYGPDAVDVTAGGGNADTDAIGESNYFFDLLFATGIDSLDDDRPGDAVLEEYEPGYSFKAGTSFAAPNVTGLAALLAAIDPEAGPEAIREVIEDTAEAISIGEDGVTTAPGANTNAAFDGEFDGDEPSNPGEEDDFDVDTYRGEGHIEMEVAVDEFLERVDDEDEDED
jgi:subtilisin family serine protease